MNCDGRLFSDACFATASCTGSIVSGQEIKLGLFSNFSPSGASNLLPVPLLSPELAEFELVILPLRDDSGDEIAAGKTWLTIIWPDRNDELGPGGVPASLGRREPEPVGWLDELLSNTPASVPLGRLEPVAFLDGPKIGRAHV